jgi:hypothetical protein
VSEQIMRELAARHGIPAEVLIEEWNERAAIREYLAGFTRAGAELWAIGDVERIYQIGLHCPETRRRWAAGGRRSRMVGGKWMDAEADVGGEGTAQGARATHLSTRNR